MDNDLDKNVKAAEWLKMAEGKWRLQTLQHRGRYNIKTGEYKELPTRLRRFLNGTPVSVITRTLEMLKEAAPYRSPVFNWEYDEGLLYRPTNTLIRKDGPEMTTNGKDATYTIIQDLRLMDEDGEVLDVADGSSCSSVSYSSYHWDESDVEGCPPGSQGVSYRVHSVNRESETDLFSYTVSKTVAITQHMAEHTVQCSDRKRVTVETYDNVYGSVGSYRYDSEIHGGAAIDVPSPCTDEKGLTVEVSVQENADCTFKISVQRTYAYADDRAFSIYKDQYKTESVTSDMNQPAPLPRTGVEYSGGVKTKYSSEKNDDGTWNNTVDVETERPVPESTYEVKVSPRYDITSWTDTNQSSPASGIPGTQYGSYKVTKTPGGLYTNEYVGYVKKIIDDLGKACEDTAFMHTHERTGMVDEFDRGHVPEAENGLVTSWHFSTDDTTGAISRTVRTRQEHTVVKSSESRASSIYGITYGYHSRSVTREVAAELLASVKNVGESVRIEMTDGRMWNVEVSEFTKAYGARISMECGKTFFRHDHDNATVVQEIGEEAHDAGGGYTYHRSYSVDPQHGTVTKHERYSKELNRPGSGGSTRITARYIETSVVNTQVEKRTEATKVGDSVEWRRTDGGLYTETVSHYEIRYGDMENGCEKTQFQHQHSHTETNDSSTVGEGHVEDARNGVIHQVSEQLNDQGGWTKRESTVTELPVMESNTETRMTPRGLVTTVTNTQIPVPTHPVPSNTDRDVGKSLQVTKTPGGLVNETYTSFSPYLGDRSRECSKTQFQHQHSELTSHAERSLTGDVEEASGGVITRETDTMTEAGWDHVVQKTTELPVMESTVEKRMTPRGLVTTVTHTQIPAPTSEEPTNDVHNIGMSRQVTKTPGKLINETFTRIDPLDVNRAEDCTDDLFRHQHSKTRTQTEPSLDGGDVVKASGGVIHRESETLTDAGWDHTHQVTKEHTVDTPESRHYKDAFGESVVHEKASAREITMDGGVRAAFLGTPEAELLSVERSRTPGDLNNLRTTKETPTEQHTPWFQSKRKWFNDDNVFTAIQRWMEFRNATEAQVRQWIREADEHDFGTWVNSHVTVSVNPSFSLNKFKLYDGRISCSCNVGPKGQAGGSTAKDNWEKELTYVMITYTPMKDVKPPSESSSQWEGHMIRCIRKTKHKIGAGVGDHMKDRVIGPANELIEGSVINWDAAGKRFTYNIITGFYVKNDVVKAGDPGSITAEGKEFTYPDGVSFGEGESK